jgi:transcriptional regulator with XRE-family HTH domain
MNKFARVMQQRCWTQASLAEALGMSERQIRRYVSGKVPVPKVVWLAIGFLEKQL